MHVINTDRVAEAVARLCQEINFCLSDNMLTALDQACSVEESDLGKQVLGLLKENAAIAAEDKLALCQDCGLAIIFIDIGQEVCFQGDFLEAAINRGVREGYQKGYLRKSVVSSPLNRVNTGDNTPAIIHSRIVPGSQVKITVAAKGGGSENMSAVRMLSPSDGAKGVVDFVVETVDKAGPNPCPPIVVGVGIGGNFEYSAELAKRALLRPVGEPHPDPEIAAMEKELLNRINSLGIGPQGLGGRVTALNVAFEVFPCHIASLPVAVNLDCHCHRHKSEILSPETA